MATLSSPKDSPEDKTRGDEVVAQSEQVKCRERLSQAFEADLDTTTTKRSYHPTVVQGISLEFELSVDDFLPGVTIIHAFCLHDNMTIATACGRVETQDGNPKSNSNRSASSTIGLPPRALTVGTGAWGSEIDVGNYFILDLLIVAQQWRSKRIGQHMLEFLINTSRKEFGVKWTFTLPDDVMWGDSQLDIPESQAERRKMRRINMERRLKFYRGLGFRRLGGSKWLGLAEDPNHPSHEVRKDADYDPPYVDDDPDF